MILMHKRSPRFKSISKHTGLGQFVLLAAITVALFALSPRLHAQSAPIGLANGTPGSATLSWTPATQPAGVTVAGYNVYRSTTAGGEAGTAAINGATLITATSYTDTSVTPGSTYFYVVTAQASGGNQSKFSNEVTAAIPTNPAPPTLTITSLVENISGKTVTVASTYLDESGIADYWMFYDSAKLLAKGNSTGGGSATWKGKNAVGPIYFAVCDESGNCQVKPATN